MAEQDTQSAEILDAVYRALCANGYADLTMQDIADECEKSTSLLHYHYDTKEDLLVAFLDDMLTEYEQRLAAERDRPPVERLLLFLARFVFDPDAGQRHSFHRALLEMRSQGPFNERIRAQLDRSDEILRGTVGAILEDGIEAGEFEPVDVDRTAMLLVGALDGARTRQITLGESDREDAYTRTVVEELLSQVIDPLLAADTDRPALESMRSELSPPGPR